MRKLLPVVLLLGSCSAAHAIDFHFDGYADFRLIDPSETGSYMDGEGGKLRFGDEHQPDLRLAEVVGQGVVMITPEIMALAVGRYEPEQRTFFDLLEGYVRYRPVSTNAWRWSVKGGVFFPPISLENTELGWTSPWTLTPSAINSWVGDELRTLGVESKLEWRSEERTLAVTAAVFGWNDPAGVLLADRGWTLDDRPTGLFDLPRVPDAVAYARSLPEPLTTQEFIEIDGRPGWYAGASWDENGLGHIDALYYNNEADPTKIRLGAVGWRTDFWNAGVRTTIGNVTLMAQGMTGETFIQPSPFFFSDTDFNAVYGLAGWAIDDEWRLAGRFDVFSTHENHTGSSVRLSEHGNAITAALNYLPNDWLRLTAEAIRVDSTRPNRYTDDFADPHAVEYQYQLSARFFVPSGLF